MVGLAWDARMTGGLLKRRMDLSSREVRLGSIGKAGLSGDLVSEPWVRKLGLEGLPSWGQEYDSWIKRWLVQKGAEAAQACAQTLMSLNAVRRRPRVTNAANAA